MVDPSAPRGPDLVVRMMKGSDTEEYSLRTFKVFEVGFYAHVALFFGLRPPGRRVPLVPTPGVLLPGVGPVGVGASAQALAQ